MLPEGVESGTQADFAGAGDGEFLQVYAPGSRVGLRDKGVLFTEVEVVAPTIMPDGSLMYQVKCAPKHAGSAPAKRWVSPDFLEPSAECGEWSYVRWNPETEEFVEEGDVE